MRAQSIRGRMALDGLRMLRSAPWRQALEAELLTFPAGRHDNQVDALGLVGQLLDRMLCGKLPQNAEPKPRDGYGRLYDDYYKRGVLTWMTV